VRIRRWDKRKEGELLKSFFSFLTCIFELYDLDVLRVLSKQTLEISNDVKYSFVLDQSLAKVMKYSALAIL